ncbi:conserved exported hypothetical protein [Candidatus Zixiibacteriota bacterium]|nr:conserved exported hypothetical protein [candidate division Zixibacteria bacterium]
MKKLTTVAGIVLWGILLINGAALAAGWDKAFDLSLNATQSSYSDSWVGGEAGNFTWVANGNGTFSKQLSPLFNLKNTSKLAFGQTLSQDKDTKKWSKPAKSTDQIDIETVGLFTIQAFIQPYVAFRFESQFLDASVTNHNRYINPMLLTESAGLARQILKKEKNEIMTRVGFAFKENINRTLIQDQVDTSLYSTKSVTATDGGVESVTDAKLVLSDKLGYIGKLSLFKAFFFSKKNDYKGTPEENYWKAVKVNWENSLVASVSKYVQVVFYTQWLYEKQVSLKGRLKETLALGMTYKLF